MSTTARLRCKRLNALRRCASASRPCPPAAPTWCPLEVAVVSGTIALYYWASLGVAHSIARLHATRRQATVCAEPSPVPLAVYCQAWLRCRLYRKPPPVTQLHVTVRPAKFTDMRRTAGRLPRRPSPGRVWYSSNLHSRHCGCSIFVWVCCRGSLTPSCC
jgi:hypothetical protein